MPEFIPENPKKAFILLHGYGSNGDDMLSLGQEFNLPDTLLLCPNAPQSLPWGGYAWFPLDDFNMDNLTPAYATRLTRQALPLVDFVQSKMDTLRQQYQISSQNIKLGGFSQGGLIALLTALLTPDIPEIIGMSAVPVSLEPITIQNKPHIILTHGGQDFVVPPVAFQFGVNQLKSSDLSVDTFISPDCAHGVDSKIMSYLKSVSGG